VVDKGVGRFLGQFAHGMDDKNRLFLPARFRQTTSDTMVLTEGLEQCLLLLPPKAWDALALKLENLPLDDKSSERAIRRTLLASASEVEPDSQGRILIPQNLREFAGIRRTAVIIGMLDHAEIWAEETWKRYHETARAAFHKAAKHLEL